jgi:hypothetical protein
MGAQSSPLEALRTKEFAHIAVFKGAFGNFPDWVDRMAAKLVRAHPKMASLLECAERQGGGHHGAVGAGVQRRPPERRVHLQRAL